MELQPRVGAVGQQGVADGLLADGARGRRGEGHERGDREARGRQHGGETFEERAAACGG
ncbi:hypothetical protein [Cellulomonas sp. JZ18]|uniref:hypothetical protein n=1 Tax=Cellulomonas sp. JZ18 TaxID=2654191 RepID=UPI001E5D4CA0|nr:hypothetical protein [Cellulomonas sp. JZ18]